MSSILSTHGLGRTFRTKGGPLMALADVTLDEPLLDAILEAVDRKNKQDLLFFLSKWTVNFIIETLFSLKETIKWRRYYMWKIRDHKQTLKVACLYVWPNKCVHSFHQKLCH